jgi:hypothetical protein
LGRVSIRRILSRSSGLPVVSIGVVGTPHMVFTNLIMIIHVNGTIDITSISSIATGRYRSTNAKNPR